MREFTMGDIRLSLEDLYRHIIFVGSTGSGKTRYGLMPLLRQLLSIDAEDADRRCGALVFDVKGDIGVHVERIAKLAGRTDPIITLGRKGNAWFDPFSSMADDTRALAEYLIEVVRSLHQSENGAYDDFWLENQRRLFQVAILLARAMGFGDLNGIEGISDAVAIITALRHCEDEDSNKVKASLNAVCARLEKAQKLKILTAGDVEMARYYLFTEASNLSSNTWSIVCNYANSYISCLKDSKIAEIFTPSVSRQVKFVPELVIDEGRIVVVSLSGIHYGRAAEVYRNLVKTSFRQSALQRYSLCHFDGIEMRPVNSTRPVAWVADEFPSCLTVGHGDDGDAFFLDKCREAKVACLLAAQGVSALGARMRDSSRVHHLLGNCATKVFFGTDCPETLAYFQMCLVSGEQHLPGKRDKSTPILRLPNYQFALGKGSTNEVFLPAQLRKLDVGEAIVLQPREDPRQTQFLAIPQEVADRKNEL